MKYREKLLELILNDDEAALQAWVESHPEIEHPDIFRELKSLAEDMAIHSGEDINAIMAEFQGLDEQINDYEDKILDEKLAEAQYIMALEEQEKAFEKLDEAYEGIRNSLINGILENEDNAELREFAAKMIQTEKDHGLYNPEDWKRIL